MRGKIQRNKKKMLGKGRGGNFILCNFIFSLNVANQFGSSLTHLDSTQTAIQTQLQTQQKILNEVSMCKHNCNKNQLLKSFM